MNLRDAKLVHGEYAHFEGIVTAAVSWKRSSGYALERFGYLPVIEREFDDQGWRFEIVDLDGRRIDKILARRIAGERRRAAVFGINPN